VEVKRSAYKKDYTNRQNALAGTIGNESNARAFLEML
jgi:hypothetical protein